MTVKVLCAYLWISRSGYYKWKNTTESKAERLNKYIMRVLKDEFIISNQKAGYRTLTMKVRRDYGLKVNHKRVRRLMRKIGIGSIIRRKRRIYTVSSEQETAENILLEYGIQKSMSRVGKCIDNAPMESFWSHYKDEAYNGKKFKLYEDLVTSIDNYVNIIISNVINGN